MATIINADTSNGLKLTSDTSGEIELQSAGTTKAKITSSGLQNASGSAITSQSGQNLIINGNMAIDQRNNGASVTPASGGYTLDRWQYIASQASKMTVQQSSVAPSGFTHSTLITTSSAFSVGSTDIFGFRQNIEGLNISDLAWGTADAKTVTISFWVRSSLTGTFAGNIQNDAQDRSYVFSFTINSANTWEQKSVTVTGDTTGTWLTTNGTGMRLGFVLGAGSSQENTAGSWHSGSARSVSGATSVVGTSGATWQITGLQLEVGDTATDFENLQYTTQLQLCQRYFSTSYGNNPVGTNTWDGTFAGRNYNTASRSENVVNIHFPVQMRANPTLTAYSKGGTSGKLVTGSITIDASATESTCALRGSNTILRAVTGASVGAAQWYQFHYTASAEL